ncbi:hypothetical protein [Psychroserpens luteolus]|uniref:hypothetical protein n=1 Tax=Psychroserpens luteolus TaxID=2855840 RepID=UPI001E5CE4D6|nr:hypothetical protein [Psychroserpens luteolus]MCD2260999.1 hypothetical protein [Psychroserpens luteolus]
MNYFRICIISISYLSINFIGQAQTDSIIKPSQTNVEIESYTLVWSQTVIEPNGTKRKGINTMTDKVIVSNDSITRSMYWVDTSNNTYTKTDVLKQSTLKPLSIDIRWNPEYVQHTDIINNTYITTSLTNSISNSKLSINTLNDSGFTWSSDGFALTSILNRNIEGTFSMQVIQGLPKNPKLGVKSFKIIDTEVLDIKKIGKVNTKKIEVLNNGNTQTTYWLSSSKPYIVKVMFEQDNGQTTIWNVESIK